MTIRRKFIGFICVVVAAGAALLSASGPAAAVNTDPFALAAQDGPVAITSAATGKCLDVDTFEGKNTEGSRVQQWHCSGATEQRWGFVFAQYLPDGYPYFFIMNSSAKCLRTPGTADGAGAVQGTCKLNGEYLWRPVNPYFDGTFAWRNPSGKCLDLDGGNSLDGAKILQWTCHYGVNQRWRGGTGNPHLCNRTYISSTLMCTQDYRTVTLFSANTKLKCADVRAEDPVNARIQQWDCKTVAEQRWTMWFMMSSSTGLVYYQFRSQSRPGQCLEAPSGGWGLQTYVTTCAAKLAQYWRYDPVPGGFNLISNAMNGGCLDVAEFSHQNQAVIQVWPCHSGVNQQWFFYGEIP